MGDSNDVFGFLDGADGLTIFGWVLDRSSTDKACEIEVVVNGQERRVFSTDSMRHDVTAVLPDFWDRDAGFRINLTPMLRMGDNHIDILAGKSRSKLASTILRRDPSAIAVGALEILADRVRANITASGPVSAALRSGTLEVKYPTELGIRRCDAIDAVLSVVIPTAVASGDSVEVTVDFAISKSQAKRWAACTPKFSDIGGGTVDLKATVDDTEEHFPPPGSRLGILFGGGVESLFGVSQLASYRPALFALTGSRFMNNDHSQSNVKHDVEERFERNLGHTIYRIDTNVRELVLLDDSKMNQFATGFWMYFLALPLMRHLDVGILFKISEYEEASIFWSYDRSLNPRFIHRVPGDTRLPAFSPFGNAFAKIQMFEELSRTPYLEYVYSCLRNTNKRWCGECGKCRRIAEYCRRLGVDGERIGMDVPSIEFRADTRVSRLYEETMNNLYPIDGDHA